jgi:hypothetical protein
MTPELIGFIGTLLGIVGGFLVGKSRQGVVPSVPTTEEEICAMFEEVRSICESRIHSGAEEIRAGLSE